MSRLELLKSLRRELTSIREELNEGPTQKNRFQQHLEQGSKAFPALIKALAEQEEAVRIDALLTLGLIFEKDRSKVSKVALDPVVQIAKKITALNKEKEAALFAIGKSGVPNLVHPFCEVLASDKPGEVTVACTVLGHAKWEQALPYLTFVATKNMDLTGPAAVWALGQIGSKESLEPLHALLVRGHRPVRVVQALAEIGDVSSLEILASMLSSRRSDIRFATVVAVWDIVLKNKGPQLRRDLVWLVPSVERVAVEEESRHIAAFAVLTLAHLGQKVEENVLRRAFNLPKKGVLTGKESFWVTRR